MDLQTAAAADLAFLSSSLTLSIPPLTDHSLFWSVLFTLSFSSSFASICLYMHIWVTATRLFSPSLPYSTVSISVHSHLLPFCLTGISPFSHRIASVLPSMPVANWTVISSWFPPLAASSMLHLHHWFAIRFLSLDSLENALATFSVGFACR